MGAAWLVYQVARRLGIERALGTQRAGKMALWQVMARVIDQGSRLSAVRLAQTHAACDILGWQRGFDENDLYENLGWLAGHQRAIEKRLFAARGQKPMLFFYDVTSSYLEGGCNELAAWGYNRDKKAGKQQIVIGLLSDEAGEPVATEVFQGNTLDLATLGLQVKKIAEVFGCQQVTLVGDRGMIKGGQIEELVQAGFHYITALTQGQIRALLTHGVLHLEALGEPLREVTQAEIRYVLRRDPQRAAELAATRRAKQERLERELTKQNRYLAEHRRARVDTALRAVPNPLARLRLEKWLKVRVEGRQLQLEQDPAALAAESRLDGCYVLKSDLAPAVADLHTIHDRYKELTEVERAFRTCKTGHLEVRPVYVRTEESTRGHVLVVMLAYLIVRYLRRAWAALDVTVEEGVAQLATLCSLQVGIKGQSACHRLPIPREPSAQLLKAARIHLPKALPSQGTRVVTRKQLPSHRPRP
jgi:Transposase DDE domain